MSATSDDWNFWLSRAGEVPAEWLRQLLHELGPCLQGEASDQDRKLLAADLSHDGCFGKTDGLGFLDDQGLKDWEFRVRVELQPHDFLRYRPSHELPLLVREFAQALDLPGIDEVDARPNEDAQRIGWQKNLTLQGCKVYRWERENHIDSPKDWVPRQALTAFDCWPEADSVQLPIFFVARDREGREQGFNGWLQIWLWPCEGAQLEWLPSVPQRVQPLGDSWVRGLQQASEWIRRQLQGQGGHWKDHALVWDVHTSDHNPYDLLLGASASAAFALAGLWLARHSAPPQWAGYLSSLNRNDWRNVRITAAIRGDQAGDGETEGDLLPVGGAGAKDRANWVLNQGDARRQAPLRVAKGQKFTWEAPGQALPEFIEYANAHELLKALARDALDLGDSPLGPLLGALQPTLHHFAPEEAPPIKGSPVTPRHLPQLEPAWQVPMAESAWQSLVNKAAADQGARTSLEAFALQRWATLAQEKHEGGSVNCLFVNLSVKEDKRAGGTYSLQQLLAEYEPDSESPAQAVQGLMVVGAPGGGKTWLLQRFEQACAERLLWQLDQRGRASEPDRSATTTQTFLDVPLYVTLSGLPTELKSQKDIVRWFCAQVLGSADAPDSPLKRRLIKPEIEPGLRLRLRIILDGVNEVKVGPKTDRATRVMGVVKALWDALKPGLPMLLGTRTYHQYRLDHTSATGRQFEVAVATLNPWGVTEIRGYLLKRWVGEAHTALRARVGELMQLIEADDAKGRRLQEVMGLPLYLRIQCELLEAGATRLLDSRAQLMAALLWRNLYREFIQKEVEDHHRADTDLFTVQERKIAQRFHDNPDQEPPPFPRKGRLLQGLFALAWAMWLDNPDEPVESRGKVALPLDDPGSPTPRGDGRRNDPRRVSVRGVLSQLGWPQRSLQRCIQQWITMAKELGWLTVDDESQTARFSHQAYGEFLASQQLFWKDRHAGWNRTPQPDDWTADERAELARLLAPAAPPRSCLEELDAQHAELARLWAKVPQALLDEWMEKGLPLPQQTVREALKRNGWSDVEIQRQFDFLEFEGERVLSEQGENWVWNLRCYGDFVRKRGVFARCDDARPWTEQPLAWALMARYTGLWRPYRDLMRQALEQQLDMERVQGLYSEVGRLPQAPPGALDEVALLAIEALADPLPWLQDMLSAARQMTPSPGDRSLAARQTGCWALLSRAMLQEASRLERSPHTDQPALAALRRDLARLLLAVNQSADPELNPDQAEQGDPDGLRAHDLRHRLQAGLCLGQLGPPGSDAGDHLRYETKTVQTPEGRSAQGVRLRREHWCEIHPDDPVAKPFFIARMPVTAGEFRAFVDAGGYQNADADWWLQGQTPERSGARAWLLEAIREGRRSPVHGPDYWGDERWMTHLQPMVGMTWYEAAAYAQWASQALYADWLAELAGHLGLASLTVRLPTESEWQAALQGVDDEGWPGHQGSGDPSPLLFNHLATGWGRTSPVGSFPASRAPSGILDGAGNGWEWCGNDPYGEPDRYCEASQENHNKLRALRGGSYNYTAAHCRAGSRDGVAPGSNLSNGFRLVLAVGL